MAAVQTWTLCVVRCLLMSTSCPHCPRQQEACVSLSGRLSSEHISVVITSLRLFLGELLAFVPLAPVAIYVWLLSMWFQSSQIRL